MPYRWNKKKDVDEAVVVVKNELDAGPELPNWLLVTLNGSIADSDAQYSEYFLKEIAKYAPKAMRFFEGRE